MKTLRTAFEKEIRNKLALKTNGKQSEETLLLKSFKYFDLDNSGECDKEEWLRALTKIGITGFNEQKLIDLFDAYDLNKNGSLDYKEFVKAIYKDDEDDDELKDNLNQHNEDAEDIENVRTALHDSKIMDKFREKILHRGGRGILGLARQFKIFDDNNSGTLDLPELTKALKDFRVDLSPNEIKILFNILDSDQSGEIHYDEFLREIRGDMSDFRKNLVSKAFAKLDHDESGHVDMDEIKKLYCCKKHPDVMNGKKTEDEVYAEFMETFQLHAALKGKGVKDREITREEFQEYYENISASIDRDDYFELVMNNAWKLGEKPKYEGKKAWKDDNPGDINSKSNATNTYQKYSNRYRKAVPASQNAPWGTSEGKISYSTSSNPKMHSMKIGKGGSASMLKFREAIARRGVRGIMSLRRSFMIADDNNDKTIDMNEFRKLIKDYRIPVEEKDVKTLFEEFDSDKNGSISYDEFLRGVIGEMNDTRMNLTKRAFKIMDTDNSGTIDISDLRGRYIAKHHPEVKAGKKTEDEILAEFLDTFEYHFNLLNDNKSKDRNITMEEWVEYYNNISMSIDEDAYFELMMNNAWNLDGKMVTKKGWKGEN